MSRADAGVKASSDADDHDGRPFAHHLRQWRLHVDGRAIRTHSSDLLPVRTDDGTAAMLKLPRSAQERRASRLMPYWAGTVAPVLALAADGSALLLLRAMGHRSLAQWARDGHDDDATRVLCATAARLHAHRQNGVPADAEPLMAWFRALQPAARTQGGLLQRAAFEAERLLRHPLDECVLHGDLHHDNVLDFGAELGWRAIDPHGLHGERGFDYANLFFNPRLADAAASDVALQPGVFERRLQCVVEASGIERSRLLGWILAYAGLSTAWMIEDGDDAALDLAIAEKATALLDA